MSRYLRVLTVWIYVIGLIMASTTMVPAADTARAVFYVA